MPDNHKIEPIDTDGQNSLVQETESPTGESSQGLLESLAAQPSTDRLQRLRMLEAILFAAAEPIDENQITQQLGAEGDVSVLLDELRQSYAGRGVNLVRVANKWVFQTAPDLANVLEHHRIEQRRLSKAALETLAVIAYHQPVTRAEIEEVRGVTTSRGTLDVLMETGWIRPRGRRRAPGKPVTYGTTDAFLLHFSLDAVSDLPGLQELKGAGLLQANLPPDTVVPTPNDISSLTPDELPLDDDNEEPGFFDVKDEELYILKQAEECAEASKVEQATTTQGAAMSAQEEQAD